MSTRAGLSGSGIGLTGAASAAGSPRGACATEWPLPHPAELKSRAAAPAGSHDAVLDCAAHTCTSVSIHSPQRGASALSM